LEEDIEGVVDIDLILYQRIITFMSDALYHTHVVSLDL